MILLQILPLQVFFCKRFLVSDFSADTSSANVFCKYFLCKRFLSTFSANIARENGLEEMVRKNLTGVAKTKDSVKAGMLLCCLLFFI